MEVKGLGILLLQVISMRWIGVQHVVARSCFERSELNSRSLLDCKYVNVEQVFQQLKSIKFYSSLSDVCSRILLGACEAARLR
jgi:hypothetical protein